MAFALLFEWVKAAVLYMYNMAPFPAIRRRAHDVYVYIKEEDDDMEGKPQHLLFILSVLSAWSLRAGLKPPGGFYKNTLIANDGTVVHRIGKAVAAYNNPVEFRHVRMAYTISILCCLPGLFLLVTGGSFKRRIVSFLMLGLLFVSVVSIAYAYKIGMEIISPFHSQ